MLHPAEYWLHRQRYEDLLQDAAHRPPDAGEDAEAKSVVADLIRGVGFEPVDVGGWGEVWIMEAPRRPGAVYGEEYHPAEARRIAEVLKEGYPEEAAVLAHEYKIRDRSLGPEDGDPTVVGRARISFTVENRLGFPTPLGPHALLSVRGAREGEVL